MPKTSKPRAGSLQYWPRKKAKKIYPNIKAWNRAKDNKLLGFIGYKVGMTYLHYVEQNKKDETFSPVTIVECPPLKPFSLRFYKKTPYGSKVITEILSKKLDKELERKISLAKKSKEEIPKEFDDMKLIVHTQPKLTSLGKKKPEIIELGVSGDLEFVKSLLEKDEIMIDEVFNENQNVDVHAVTKGKGTQGPVKRFGVGLKQHKSEKGIRRVGSLGDWKAKTWRVAHAGQTGFHKRTEYNKKIFLISGENINSEQGFRRYGLVKNKYVLLKGSIPGAKKRTIVLTEPLRDARTANVEITSIKK